MLVVVEIISVYAVVVAIVDVTVVVTSVVLVVAGNIGDFAVGYVEVNGDSVVLVFRCHMHTL